MGRKGLWHRRNTRECRTPRPGSKGGRMKKKRVGPGGQSHRLRSGARKRGGSQNGSLVPSPHLRVWKKTLSQGGSSMPTLLRRWPASSGTQKIQIVLLGLT